jgi:hypothetical protein
MTHRKPASRQPAVRPLHLADARQCALLLLRVFELRNEQRQAKGVKPMTRAKLTAPMLKALWNRRRLSPEFLQEVADWLLFAGWVLFFAGPVYGAVQVSAVQNWPRVSTTAIGLELKEIAEGRYPFAKLERLLWDPDDEMNMGDDRTTDDTTLDDDE